MEFSPLTDNYTYAIVFDAGSTGTRLHIYRFRRRNDGASAAEQLKARRKSDSRASSPPRFSGSLELVDELLKEIKPGLSAYASNPVDAADSIEPLLQLAKNFVPSSDWTSTPIALYATAGLRLLSESVSRSILEETISLIRMYPFHVCTDCVRILDGLDEGVYGWYALNYLLSRSSGFEAESERSLSRSQSNSDSSDTRDKSRAKQAARRGKSTGTSSVGLIDLGGGSLQITFHAQSSRGVPTGYLHDVQKFGQPFTVYSHSYLGLGLMATRMQLLDLSQTQFLQSRNNLPPTDQGTRLEDVPVVQSDNENQNSRLQPSQVRQANAQRRQKSSQSEDSLENDRYKTRTGTSSLESPTRSKRDVNPVLQPNTTYHTPCLLNGHSASFRFQNLDIAVRGTWPPDNIEYQQATDRFQTCYALARSVVTSPQNGVHAPREVRSMQFYIQSYFFDRAIDANLISGDEGGSVTLNDYELLAKATCSAQEPDNNVSFQCMDLCIIVALLRDGFQFEQSSSMMVAKMVNKVELSWTLGAAFPLLASL